MMKDGALTAQMPSWSLSHHPPISYRFAADSKPAPHCFMKVDMKRKRAYFFTAATIFTCFLGLFHANGEMKTEPMSQLLDNVNDDTSSSINKKMLQNDKNKYYGIPSMNDANHRGNGDFAARQEGDLLTVACVNARRRFNADNTLMHNLMEF